MRPTPWPTRRLQATLPHSRFARTGLAFRPGLPICPYCAPPRRPQAGLWALTWSANAWQTLQPPGPRFSGLSSGASRQLRACSKRSLICSPQPRVRPAGFHRITSFPPQAPPDPSAQTSRAPHKTLPRVSLSVFSPSPASPRRLPRPCAPWRGGSSSDAHRRLSPLTSTSAGAHARALGVLPARARAPRPPARCACALRAAPPPRPRTAGACQDRWGGAGIREGPWADGWAGRRAQENPRPATEARGERE